MMRKASIACAALVAGMMMLWVAPLAAADHGTDNCPNDKRCKFPTPADCARGDHNGTWDGGEDGRGAVCVGGGGSIVLYTGGNANTQPSCGDVIVANQNVSNLQQGGDPSDWGEDPNTCP